NMARQRYCRRLVRSRNTLRVSADPVARPAAHTRAESRGFRPTKAASGERRTLCWRKVDSNRRSLWSLRPERACAPGAKDGLAGVVYVAATKGSKPLSSASESIAAGNFDAGGEESRDLRRGARVPVIELWGTCSDKEYCRSESPR